MGDQNIFTTPQQNILAAKVLCDTIEPMLAEDHAATPIITRIKAMVMAAAIQQHQEGNRALSISRPAASRQPSVLGQEPRKPTKKHGRLQLYQSQPRRMQHHRRTAMQTGRGEATPMRSTY